MDKRRPGPLPLCPASSSSSRRCPRLKHQRAKSRLLKSVVVGAAHHQQRTSQAAASSDQVRGPPSFRRRSPSDPVARAPSLLLLAVVFFMCAANVRSSLCFEQRRRTPVSRCPSTAACPRPRRRRARRRRIHVSSMPVLVYARLHGPSASSSTVTDKTESAREPPWLRPLRPCARMPRCCSR
ncbi:uncharacterized protein LOC125541551 [Triticum urartu]|uniref:uncharacterized protein LOC125541549 n=1 Tax=Triticum urartu TaxID=4572 RepID=UPI0020448955|nr:uncharacterized protein LOC125541549 [Triticum urartu]XP_048560886.1 uncharacterized protein LOC125541551 [Triticum urartu]